ncbi:MAG: hypothetical protein GZ086_12185 [Gelidibacter sp.]|nr:hypothetical protein [Gelidibacter sp.]
MHWRKLTRLLHRDIGYIAAGLTVIYAISGIAVNHIQDWNPNYKIEKSTIVLDSIPSNLTKDEMVLFVLKSIGETGVVKNTFRASPNELEIFVDGNTILVDYNTKEVEQEKFNTRFLLKESNDLHLNKPKGIWTYIADLFAVALLFLAISGLFMIKGKNGIKGRGFWLTIAGILIPVAFWLYYYL